MQVQAAAVSSNTVQPGTPSQVSNPTLLDKNAFLQLLVAQLKNQDPMSPMDSNQFISQMAQFSTVEQLTNIYQTLDQMARENGLTQGASLVGRQVTMANNDGTTVTGTVQKVALVDNNVCLYVNDKPYGMGQVTEVQ